MLGLANQINSQRNLLHLRRDLEYRLNSYLNERAQLSKILESSIYPSQLVGGQQLQGPFAVAQVRFSDLVIPSGSLILERHIAQPTIRILVNKTKSYVNSKMNEIYQVQSQLDNVKRQIGSQQYIHKGYPNGPRSQLENPNVITGVRVFKQFQYGQLIEGGKVDVRSVNGTDVSKVLNETYMAYADMGLVDPQSRLFFEGRKTFWHTVFTGNLRSGCCDRLKPLHTDRMMTRHSNQNVVPPILINSSDISRQQPALIRNLTCAQIHNRLIDTIPVGDRPDEYAFKPSQMDNQIHLNNLIHTVQPNQPDILKTIIFKDSIRINDAQLLDPSNARGLVIGVANRPGLYYDLNHGNYLLRYSISRNATTIASIPGTVVIRGSTLFYKGLNADKVNHVTNFTRFIIENVVRLDRPASIRGTVQFMAQPISSLQNPIGGSQPFINEVPIMFVSPFLEVGRVNGLRIPQDLIFLEPSGLAPKSNQIIRFYGSRIFASQVIFKDFLQVNRLVNGLLMPQGVIPLHLNDFMSSVGASNIWFVDGITAQHLTIHSGQFDDIIIRESDAQNIIMQSVFARQPDGSHIIRSPLHIVNLRFIARGPDHGLLNGFHPLYLLELGQLLDANIYGSKTFLGPVEADDCLIADINNLPNWPNHLIRVDRPNLIQNVQTRLIFEQPIPLSNLTGYQNRPQNMARQMSSIAVNHFNVDFHQDESVHHIHNWNLSPEFYMMHQALIRAVANHTGGVYKVLDQVRLLDPERARVNGIVLDDIVTLSKPFKFEQGFVLVGKVTIENVLRAGRVTSNYPLDVMDLVQFSKLRLPILGSRAPVRLSNLVLSTNNRASFVQSRMLNGISFDEFAASIMSLTRPQIVNLDLIFGGPTSFEGLIHTHSSLNNIVNFRQFANELKSARYSFEDGLQCGSVIIRA